jgi:hypothetical protein
MLNKKIKKLTVKELDILAMEYSLEIVMYRRKIKELEKNIEIINLERDKRIKEDKAPKLKIKFLNFGDDGLDEF